MPKLASDIKRKLTGENPVLTVNLKEMFDLPFFPESDSLRQAIGQAIIDKIKENTSRGEFLEQSAGAKKYSKEYAESYEFKVYGKQQGRVNLKASGDMLGSIELALPDDKNKVVIDFSDETEAAKAHGHITGNVGKKRDFFGLSDADLSQLAKQFEPRVLDAMLAFQAGEQLKQQADGQSDLDFLLQRIADGEG